MSLVVNNVVKMEWEESGWLATKGSKGKEGTFIYATKEYTNADGNVIPVYFNGAYAFLWMDEGDDIWESGEFKAWVKENYDGSFPVQYDQFVPIMQNDDSGINTDIIAKYGLTEHQADIEARFADLLPYTEEKIIDPTGEYDE